MVNNLKEVDNVDPKTQAIRIASTVGDKKRELIVTKADELGMSIYNLAMAWVMSHPAVTSTIAGARRLEHIDNALEAAEVKLNPSVRAEIAAWRR